jgi:PAS domain S-box-containing protein
VKKKIAFAHRMSLMFIMGGALMGLLIGLVVTVSTSKAVNKIRAVEKALRQSDERFELVLEATTDGVWDWDVPSDKAYCSPTYYAMLGYRDGEIHPQTWKALWHDLIHPDDRQVAMQTVQTHIEKRDDSYELEFRMAHKSGSYIWIYDRGRVTQRDPQGKPLRVVGTLVDISRRKQMEEDLKQAKDAAETANKAKSVFLANMSHELRTPLNAVLGFSQLMRKDSTITESQSENLDIIKKSGEHLLNLINDVLDVSKIEAGRIFLEEKEFDLSNMIMDITDMMQYRANSKGLKLRIDRSSNFPRYIYGDQAKMRQILLNLLSNAIKYTKKGFVILRLNIAKRDKGQPAHLHLEVEDSGIGISRENRKKIFEPFEQIIKHVDAARGTGLGLAITRQYVELMAGKITVESRFGKGSIFRVDLPVETVTDKDFKRVESSFGQVIALEEGQPSYRILIVEDNLNSRKLLRKILERVGFTVREAITGQEAVDIFKEFHPHLIWMDRRLPVMSGLAATRRIKKLETGRKTIIVALTASVFREQRDEVLAAGCDDFVSKPFQEKEILETIARHLNVRYRYAASGQKKNRPPKDRPLYHLTDNELRLLPDEAWIKAFTKAVRAAQGDLALELVNRLGPELSPLAIKLEHLIGNYRFDMLVAWIEMKKKGLQSA